MKGGYASSCIFSWNVDAKWVDIQIPIALTYDPQGQNLDFYYDTLWRCRESVYRWSPAADPHYRRYQCRRFPRRGPSSRTYFRYADVRHDNCCQTRTSCDHRNRRCSRSSCGHSQIVCGRRHWIYSRHVCDRPRVACNRRNHPLTRYVCAQTYSSWSRFSCAHWLTPFLFLFSFAPLTSRCQYYDFTADIVSCNRNYLVIVHSLLTTYMYLIACCLYAW